MENKAETNCTVCGKCVWKISMEKFGKWYSSKISVHRNIKAMQKILANT